MLGIVVGSLAVVFILFYFWRATRSFRAGGDESSPCHGCPGCNIQGSGCQSRGMRTGDTVPGSLIDPDSLTEGLEILRTPKK